MHSRRKFIKNTSIASISLILPQLMTFTKKLFSKNALIGKEKIKFYGSYKLQKEAYVALENMITEAKLNNVKIHVVSGYRSFEHQNRIWEKKFANFRKKGYSTIDAVNKVKEYTAIPGTSRHHWGTDVDLVDYRKKFERNLSSSESNKKYTKWMDDNAHKFGFYRVFTKNKFRKGYNYESWHYSYRKIAKPMLEAYLELDIVSILSHEEIAGNAVFTKEFLQNYVKNNVLGINDYLF
ncbi:MAG: M15 family metallopeptidase [Flavobacteriaceae bacterium]